METTKWSRLPLLVVESIISLLPVRDRLQVGLVCRQWYAACTSPEVWHNCSISFTEDDNPILCAEKYVKHMRSINIEICQDMQQNRVKACQFLDLISHRADLINVKICFIGMNPLFYGGQDILNKLTVVFQNQHRLRCVDMSALPISFNNELIDLLSLNNTKLKVLNIANDASICCVDANAVKRLVQRCKNLSDIHVHYFSMSEEVMRQFTLPDRTSIRNISLWCRSEQKVLKTLSSEGWTKLTLRSPMLCVDLHFDHTCPVEKVQDVMKAEMPVRDLFLETYTPLEVEVNNAAIWYTETLEKLVLQTSNSPALSAALINLCRNCKKLKALLVYCVLDINVVLDILSLCPSMKSRGSYVLRWKLDPEPWLMEHEERLMHIQK